MNSASKVKVSLFLHLTYKTLGLHYYEHSLVIPISNDSSTTVKKAAAVAS